MKLFHLIFGTTTAKSAPYYWIQHGHRQTAISAAIAIFGHHRELEKSSTDFFTTARSDTIHDWLIETLIQGAYLREYHIWEKDVKAYLNDQRQWNGNNTGFDWRPRGKSMVARTQVYLAEFGVMIDDQIMKAIEIMRSRVNPMKHEPGLSLEHFVSTKEYYVAHRAIEEFWEHLTKVEESVMSLPNAKSS